MNAYAGRIITTVLMLRLTLKQAATLRYFR
jgi:hypothetical protein